MEFLKTNRFDKKLVRSMIMGPNTLKLCEELLEGEAVEPGSVVLDLGSGSGISSAMLAREYGLVTYHRDERDGLHARGVGRLDCLRQRIRSWRPCRC